MRADARPMLRRLFGAARRARPLRIAIVSFDDPAFPCARIRVLDPLAKCGNAVEVRHALAHTAGGWTFDESALDWAELIVVQRGVPRADTAALCERVLGAGRPVVYETDDCLPEIPAYHEKDHYRQNGPRILDFAARADLVTVSTEPLRQYFEPHNPRTTVLPNYLNEDLWTDFPQSAATADDDLTLGYVGNRGHRGDLALVAGALRRLQDEFPRLRLVFVGCSPEGFVESARCAIVPPNFDYATFPHRLAALRFDLAIAPLLDNAFNRCVSNLKLLEYGFLGIPAVYSDVPAYRDAARSGAGVLSGDSEDEWYSALASLVRDSELRRSMGRAAKHAVRTWMLGPHAHRWLDTYSALASAPPAKARAV